MLFEQLKELNTSEIREMIITTTGEEQLFYVSLFNKVMQLRRIETLQKEKKFGNYNKITVGEGEPKKEDGVE